MEKIAILIPIYNGLNYTKLALENLKHNILESNWVINENIFIIIVDDGSTDGSEKWVHDNFPEVIILKGDGNLWWSGAINLGARHALEVLHCNYVLLWNNDIVVKQQYFINLYDIINAESITPLFGSKITIKNSNLIWFMGGTFNPVTGKKTMIGLGKQDDGLFLQAQTCDWLTGMGTVVHKSVIDKIGYWDFNNFPQYHGDTDFTLRALKANFTMKVYPCLIIENDITNTGLSHHATFKSLMASLTSIKSDFNFKKDFLFYQKYATSPFAFIGLFIKYFKYIGGFLKHKYFKI